LQFIEFFSFVLSQQYSPLHYLYFVFFSLLAHCILITIILPAVFDLAGCRLFFLPHSFQLFFVQIKCEWSSLKINGISKGFNLPTSHQFVPHNSEFRMPSSPKNTPSKRAAAAPAEGTPSAKKAKPTPKVRLWSIDILVLNVSLCG